jgi:hypothetical protein
MQENTEWLRVLRMNAPSRYRVLNRTNSGDYRGSRQVSDSNAFRGRGPLVVGTPLEVSLKMRRGLAGYDASNLKCMARVNPVEPSAFLGGEPGIGMRSEKYDRRADDRTRVEIGAGARIGPGKEPWASESPRSIHSIHCNGHRVTSVSTGRHANCRLGARDVFKLVVHTHRNGVLACSDFL